MTALLHEEQLAMLLYPATPRFSPMAVQPRHVSLILWKHVLRELDLGMVIYVFVSKFI